MLSSAQKAELWDKLTQALGDERLFIQEIQDDSPIRPLREEEKLVIFLWDYQSPEVEEDEDDGDDE